MNENNDYNESSVDAMKKKLYQRQDGLPEETERARFHTSPKTLATDWEHDHGNDTARVAGDKATFRFQPKKQHHTAVKWFVIGAVAFFLLALIFVIITFTGDRAVVSSDKIELSVRGPVSVAGGEELLLQIELDNGNATDLESADLFIEYPEGTRSPVSRIAELPRFQMAFGKVPSGGSVATTTKAILFGQEGETKDIIVTIEYRVRGSNAIFVKERVFTVAINSAPVSILVDAPDSLNTGQDIELVVDVVSNSSSPIENVVVEADYPFGFIFEASDPETQFSNTMWQLGDIEPLGKRTIIVKGIIEGQDNEERIFRFHGGVANDRDPNSVGTAFLTALHPVRIARPFVQLGVQIAGQQDNLVIAQAGRNIRSDISYRNNLPTSIADAVVKITFAGDALDERSVSSLSGFYDSRENTLTWDKRDVPELALIKPGEGGVLSFNFASLDVSTLGGRFTNPEIMFTSEMRALPISETETPEEIFSQTKDTVRITSDVGLATEALYFVGPFENTGPMPPEAEQETTYTIVWAITNSTNDITDGVVRAVLPSYVTWKGVVSPENEEVIFNQSDGQVIWRVGEVSSGIGYGVPRKEVAFQIGLVPSVTQVGTNVVLIEDATLSAQDSFTSTTLSSTATELNTRLTTDPEFEENQGRVRD